MAIEKKEFVLRLAEIADGFDIALKSARIAVYYERLKTFDDELFAKVCDYIITEGERFPLIADFHRLARTKFKREINGDYTIRHD